MKKLALLTIILATMFACNKTGTKKTEQKTDPIAISKPVEEIPNIYTAINVTRDLGTFIYDSYSGGVKNANANPLKALAKVVKENPNCEIIIATYYRKWSSGDNPGTVKIEYNRSEKEVRETTESGVADVYRNISDDVIIKAANDVECSVLKSLTYYSNTEMETDFSGRKLDAVGEKPEQSDLDYSVKIVADYVKKTHPDAKFIEWSLVSSIGKDWVVRAKYITNEKTINSWFYMQNNKVLRTKKIE